MKHKMADNSKGGIFTSAKKNLIRQKTKVLQSLGKTGKTTDDILSEDCQKLEKQQEVATKFQKDLRQYIHSAKNLSHASKQFYTTASETYEEEWENHGQVVEILKNMDVLWDDYLQKLNDQIHEPLTKYLANIPQIKARVAKCGRKLIDYDNTKHNLEVLQNAKKKDDAKITKAQEDLDHAKKIYEDLNNELHQELPEFYNSRLTFYGNLFQNLFTAENVFYTEAGKGSQQVAAAGAKLAKDNEEHTYTPRKSVRNTIIVGSDENLMNGHSDSGPDSPQPDSPSPTSSEPTANDTSVTQESKTPEKSPEPTENNVEAKSEPAEDKKDDKPDDKTDDDKSEQQQSKPTELQNDTEPTSTEKEEEEPKVNGDLDTSTSTDPELPDTAPPPVPSSPPPGEDNDQNDKDKEVESEPATKPASDTTEEVDKNASKDDDDDDDDDEDESVYQVPPTPKPVDEDYPPKYLYTVCATHKYEGEDDDELSFEPNEYIYVVDFENPEEQQKLIEKKKSDQDPGWLMGMKKSTRTMGVFPENFTTKVSEPNPTQTT